MAFYHDKLILLPPNRVWRTYPGGRVLDILAGKDDPGDSSFPEDWIASLTKAFNPGREGIEEGVSIVGAGGRKVDFKSLIESDPEYFLGKSHLRRYGLSLMVLVKFLDSAIRLHLQCHPTAEFARKHLNFPSGKTEAYHILGFREEEKAPYIYLGFQRPPAKADLKRWIQEQDIEAMESCFDKVPVRKGDTFIIPGGLPHAIGEGIFMVEIMEPSDLVVRFEFAKAGYVLPESARFMNRGLDFALSLLDFSPCGLSEIERKFKCLSRPWRNYNALSRQDFLIGTEETNCFSVRRSILRNGVEKSENSFYIGIILHGACSVKTDAWECRLKQYDKFFAPHGLASLAVEPDTEVEILECYPPD